MRRIENKSESKVGKSGAAWSSAAIIVTMAALILASIFLTSILLSTPAFGQTLEPKQSQPQIASATASTTAPKAASAPQTPPATQRKIVISVPHRKLALMENGRAVKTYAVAVGAEVSPSPSGSFRVVNRLTAPTYYHTGKVIPPGKSNPLGTRWIGLDRKSYGIHGTNQPKSIGKAASHGCIRMARADLEELFTLVRVGDEVEIHAESDATLAELFGAAVAPAAADAASTEGGALDNK